MARVFDNSLSNSEYWNRNTVVHLKRWQKFWGRRHLNIVEDKQVATAAVWKEDAIIREIEKIRATHGSFDNDILVVDQTIRRMTGSPLKHKVENLRY